MPINYNRDIKRAALIQQTADITGVSIRSVRRVLESQQTNENVMAVYMTLLEGTNSLLAEVKRVVPFFDEPIRSKVSNRSTSSTPAK